MNVNELHTHILDYIQGVFSEQDMELLKEEVEKLKPGDVYVEIGVDEGRSARTAHEYADPGVYKLWIDTHDVVPHEVSIGRAPWMEQEGMVGHHKNGFYVHGDADHFAEMLKPHMKSRWVNLMFIDGDHDYESVKRDTLLWEKYMVKGGVMLFHDYDHPDCKRWLDEFTNGKPEVLHGKMVRVRK